MIPLVDAANFEEEVLTPSLPVLLACMRTKSEPDEQVAMLEKMARSLAGKVKICLMEEAGRHGFASRYRIFGTPTYLLFFRGKVRERLLGMTETSALTRFVKESIPFGYKLLEFEENC